jgi:hypothetical protein
LVVGSNPSWLTSLTSLRVWEVRRSPPPVGALVPARTRVVTKSTPIPSVRRWIILRVAIIAKGGESLSPPPGRDRLASSSHTFAELATAIDRAFGRWDLGHLHEFRFSDGRVVGMADTDEFGDEGEIDERAMTIGAAALAVGDSFEYLFDFGDAWEHTCTLLRGDVDPIEESGRRPHDIVPIFGWGALPDQYGRTAPDAPDRSTDEDADAL